MTSILTLFHRFFLLIDFESPNVGPPNIDNDGRRGTLTFDSDTILTVCIVVNVYEDELFENSSEVFNFRLITFVSIEALIIPDMRTTLVYIHESKQLHVFICF